MHIFHKRTKRWVPVYNSVDSAFIQSKVCKSCGKLKVRKEKYIYWTCLNQLETIKEQLQIENK